MFNSPEEKKKYFRNYHRKYRKLDKVRKSRNEYYREYRKTHKKPNGICLLCNKITDGCRYCYDCRIARRHENRKRSINILVSAIDKLGGKCMDCGLISSIPLVYEIIHTDPLLKVNLKEIDINKHILLCSNCYKIRNYRLFF